MALVINNNKTNKLQDEDNDEENDIDGDDYDDDDKVKSKKKKVQKTKQVKKVIAKKREAIAAKPKIPFAIPTLNPTTTTGVNTTLLSEKTLFTGQKLIVLQADIVNVVADAIIHPTSNNIYMGGQVGKY